MLPFNVNFTKMQDMQENIDQHLLSMCKIREK